VQFFFFVQLHLSINELIPTVYAIAAINIHASEASRAVASKDLHSERICQIDDVSLTAVFF